MPLLCFGAKAALGFHLNCLPLPSAFAAEEMSCIHATIRVHSV